MIGRFGADRIALLRDLPGELGSLLQDGHQPLVVDVRELLSDGGAALGGLGEESSLRESAQEIQHDG
jgi:hypothetical protein